jgi:hypothetical protein
MAKHNPAPQSVTPQAKISVGKKAIRQAEVDSAIPQDAKGFLIGVAICMGNLRQTRTAIKHYRDRIEARMPGGSRFVWKPGLVAALIEENNAVVAKRKAVQV